MRILYGGLRIESLELLITLPFVEFIDIVTFPNSRITSFEKMLKSCKKINSLWVLPKKKSYTLEFLENLLKERSYDIFLSVGFPYIIPKEILNLKKNILFLNLHPHILPKWKGNNAIKESFYKGEKEFGATLHIITEKVDEGPIVSRYKFHLENPTLDLIYNLTFSIAEPLTLFEGLKKLVNF